MDWGDFYMVVRKARDIYGAESAQVQFAKKSLESLWEGLCKLADADDVSYCQATRFLWTINCCKIHSESVLTFFLVKRQYALTHTRVEPGCFCFVEGTLTD